MFNNFIEIILPLLLHSRLRSSKSNFYSKHRYLSKKKQKFVEESLASDLSVEVSLKPRKFCMSTPPSDKGDRVAWPPFWGIHPVASPPVLAFDLLCSGGSSSKACKNLTSALSGSGGRSSSPPSPKGTDSGGNSGASTGSATLSANSSPGNC